jgi:hypothetical protein
MSKKAQFIFLFVTLFFLRVGSPVHAQAAATSSGSSTAATKSATPSAKVAPALKVAPTLAEQLQTLHDKYRDQLATYRNDERRYDVAKEQYTQLGTLASLEESVRATRQVMLSRIILIHTYFDLLKLQLANTKGIDLNMKNAQLQLLDTALQIIQKHQTKVEKAVDKDGLIAMEAEFATFGADLDVVAQLTRNMITYGNLQSVYDKTRTVTNEIIDQVQKSETNPLTLAEKKRGFTEINRNLDAVGEVLTSIRTALQKQQNDPKNGNSLSDGDSQLNDIYGGIARSLSFLDEVLKK